MEIGKYFEEQIKESLKKLSNKQKIRFAWLCAVRALPFLSITRNFNYWDKNQIQKHLFSILRAIDISANIATSSADSSAVATSSADSSAVATSSADSSAVATSSAYAASAFATTLKKVKTQEHLLSLFLSDIEKIYENKLNEFDNNLNTYGEIWGNFQNNLKSIGCGYWAKLYSDLFLNKFQIDTESLERRLNVPKEIQEKGAYEVGKWLENLELQGAEHLNEARLIILGEKGAGKTSLAFKLHDINAKLSEKDESTKGVDISVWNLPENSDGDAMNVHIWDFAGHVVTHSTHKFFLSERCIYIIVYDGRTERRNFLEYWLDHVINYGGDSPVFILVNKRDSHLPDIDENGLMDKYPNQIQAFYYFSLSEDIKEIEKFRKTIEKFIKSHAVWNNKIPKLWFAVKEKLNKLFSDEKVDCITTAEFKNIAQSLNVTKTKDFEDMKTGHVQKM